MPLALPAQFQGSNFLRLIGRMKPGVTLAQATDDLRAVTAAFNQANNLQRDVKTYLLHDYLSSRNRQMLLVLQGTVAFVLLIACANVANLLLARSVSRGTRAVDPRRARRGARAARPAAAHREHAALGHRQRRRRPARELAAAAVPGARAGELRRRAGDPRSTCRCSSSRWRWRW